jgi:hypothetical protein
MPETQQAVEAAKQEARNIAKDFAGEGHLGYVTLVTWACEPKSEGNQAVLEGDFTDAQRDEILGAGIEMLPTEV